MERKSKPGGERQPLIRGKAILVVEDAAEVAELSAGVLRRDGHVIDVVENGAEAISRLRQRPYHVIVSDVRMPTMDGLSLYEAIARLDARLLCRLVFLTGDTLTARTQEFLARTQVRWLSKPFTLADVRAVVQTILRTHVPCVINTIHPQVGEGCGSRA